MAIYSISAVASIACTVFSVDALVGAHRLWLSMTFKPSSLSGEWCRRFLELSANFFSEYWADEYANFSLWFLQ